MRGRRNAIQGAFESPASLHTAPRLWGQTNNNTPQA